MAAHVKWVRTISEQTVKRSGDARPSSMLLEALPPLASSDVQELGYRNLVGALSHATGENRSHAQPRSNGYFSAIHFAQDIASDVVLERKRELSMGTKSFFERQFEDFARNHVQQGVALNRISFPAASQGDSRKQLIKAFVHYMYRSNRFPESCMASTYEDGVGDKRSVLCLWPLIYFSMRIGAIDIAQEEIDVCISRGMRGIDASVVILVATFGRLMNINRGKPLFRMYLNDSICLQWLLRTTS